MLEKRESKSRPTQGIVTVETRAWKQDGTTVMTFKRSVLVPKAPMNDSRTKRQILDAIAKWLERDVRPKARELEKKDEYPQAMVETMKALGLFGATIPPEYGGLGLPASTYAKIVAQISEVWMSLTGIFNSHLIMAAAVARYGTEAQKKKFLPKFASGEIRGGLALTEPDCGTDLQAIRTRAVKRRRPLRRQRHQDLDLQRHPGLVLRAAGEDRSRTRSRATRA